MGKCEQKGFRETGGTKMTTTAQLELEKNGYIYKGKHEGWYAVSDEAFYTNDQIQQVVDEATGEKKMVCTPFRATASFSPLSHDVAAAAGSDRVRTTSGMDRGGELQVSLIGFPRSTFEMDR